MARVLAPAGLVNRTGAVASVGASGTERVTVSKQAQSALADTL